VTTSVGTIKHKFLFKKLILSPNAIGLILINVYPFPIQTSPKVTLGGKMTIKWLYDENYRNPNCV
jgi:hypothetical protein